MKGTPRFFHGLLTLSLVFISLFIMLFSLITYRKVSRDLNSLSRQMMLNQVLVVSNTFESLVDESSGRLLSFMTVLEREDITEETERQVLDEFVHALPQCRRVFVLSDGDSMAMSSGTNWAYLESAQWWQPYLERMGQTDYEDFQGRYEIISEVGEPFMDEMGLDTVLPITFFLLAGIDVKGLAFLEIDLTRMFKEYMMDFNLVLVDETYPLDVILYDREGHLLESSWNIPLATGEVPEVFRSCPIPFNDRSFYSGAIYREDGERTTVYYRHTGLGLIFAGSLPRTAITASARRAAVFILLIGFLCLLSLSGLGLILLRTYHRMKQYERDQASARFASLQNKMNPHFLFNTLDSMVGVAEKKDYPVLISMLRHLSNILHMNLRITRDVILLSDEIRYINSYVELQRIRYKDQFSFRLDVPDYVERLEILRFCIQPVVENCFVHGVARRSGFVDIEVEIKRQGDYLQCDVINKPSPVEEDIVHGLKEKLSRGLRNEKAKHLGLLSIHRRLRILYGEDYGIELFSPENAFHVRIKFPCLE